LSQAITDIDEEPGAIVTTESTIPAARSDLNLYAALIGHTPVIDPAEPSAFSERWSDDARRLAGQLVRSIRDAADRPDWLGDVVRAAQQRVDEARDRLARASRIVYRSAA
jgi:phenylalanyl-tRNA synthetase beta subunit